MKKGEKMSDEQKKKLSLAKIGKYAGENHPNWKGGVYIKDPKKYQKERSIKLKEQIRKRNHDLWKKRRMAVIGAYSCNRFECECCFEKEIGFLTVDHINGGGNRERSKPGGHSNFYRRLIEEGFPFGYRILCFNCNWGVHANKGTCYHKCK